MTDLPSPVWDLFPALEAWQALLLAIPVAAIAGAAVGIYLGLREGVRYRVYKWITGRDPPDG